MRGISRQAIPYVLTRDQGVPDGEQTTFWIRPRKGDSGAKIVARYTAAERTMGQYREISESRWRQADVKTWLDTVERVENFWFSDEFPELAAHEWMADITDPDVLTKVMRDIALEDYNEIINYAAKVSSLTDQEKNGSSSSPISSRGSARSEKGKSAILVPHASG